MTTPPTPFAGCLFRGQSVGLLGGSFNPAHGGHRALSLTALKRLGLDWVWWLVAPQNPLKPSGETFPLADRIVWAESVAAHPRILVTGIEASLGTRYTADTLSVLRRRFPATRFVWLMGADNLAQFHRWRDWPRIAATVPVAVFARPSYSFRALAGPAAHRLARHRMTGPGLKSLARRSPPAWGFVFGLHDPRSATALRSAGHRPALPANRTPTPFVKAATPLPEDAPASPSQALIDLIVDSLDEDKAEDIVAIDLIGKAAFADAMVVATGRSSRQVAALSEKLTDRLREAGYRKPTGEGAQAGDWVVLDAGDVVVHLFRPEVRAFYGIEKMWDPDGKAPRRNPAPPRDEGEDDVFGYTP